MSGVDDGGSDLRRSNNGRTGMDIGSQQHSKHSRHVVQSMFDQDVIEYLREVSKCLPEPSIDYIERLNDRFDIDSVREPKLYSSKTDRVPNSFGPNPVSAVNISASARVSVKRIAREMNQLTRFRANFADRSLDIYKEVKFLERCRSLYAHSFPNQESIIKDALSM